MGWGRWGSQSDVEFRDGTKRVRVRTRNKNVTEK